MKKLDIRSAAEKRATPKAIKRWGVRVTEYRKRTDAIVLDEHDSAFASDMAAEHEETLALVEPIALAKHRAGETRLSGLALIEDARSAHHVSLGNNFAPHIARALVAKHPQLAPCFELKPLGRGGKHHAASDFTVFADWIVEQGGELVAVTARIKGNAYTVNPNTVAEVAKKIRGQ